MTRLLHPKPELRIETIAKALQHRYFHEEIVESKKIFKRGRKNGKMKTNTKDLSETDSYANSYGGGKGTPRTRSVSRSRKTTVNRSTPNRRSLSRRRGAKR